jgi:hypothetical protein
VDFKQALQVDAIIVWCFPLTLCRNTMPWCYAVLLSSKNARDLV